MEHQQDDYFIMTEFGTYIVIISFPEILKNPSRFYASHWRHKFFKQSGKEKPKTLARRREVMMWLLGTSLFAQSAKKFGGVGLRLLIKQGWNKGSGRWGWLLGSH